jgi:hypothetical protein
MDEAALTEVRRLMDINSCGFDEARLLRHNRHLAKNGESLPMSVSILL